MAKKEKTKRETKLAGESARGNAKSKLGRAKRDQEEIEEVSGDGPKAGPETKMVGEETPERKEGAFLEEEALVEGDAVKEAAASEEQLAPAQVIGEVPTTGMTIDLKSDKKGFLDSLGEQKLLVIGLAAAFALALAGGGYYFYQSRGVEAPRQRPETSETEAFQPALPPQTETEEVSPTSAPYDRKDLKIKVLNGSGVSGTAGQAKKFLEDLGYEDVEVGNADSYDYEQTEIAIKEDRKNYLELLQGDLAGEYTLAEETTTLDEDSDFDAIITIGK